MLRPVILSLSRMWRAELHGIVTDDGGETVQRARQVPVLFTPKLDYTIRHMPENEGNTPIILFVFVLYSFGQNVQR